MEPIHYWQSQARRVKATGEVGTVWLVSFGLPENSTQVELSINGHCRLFDEEELEEVKEK